MASRPDHMRRFITADGFYFKKEPEITDANLTDDDQTDNDCKKDVLIFLFFK